MFHDLQHFHIKYPALQSRDRKNDRDWGLTSAVLIQYNATAHHSTQSLCVHGAAITMLPMYFKRLKGTFPLLLPSSTTNSLGEEALRRNAVEMYSLAYIRSPNVLVQTAFNKNRPSQQPSNPMNTEIFTLYSTFGIRHNKVLAYTRTLCRHRLQCFVFFQGLTPFAFLYLGATSWPGPTLQLKKKVDRENIQLQLGRTKDDSTCGLFYFEWKKRCIFEYGNFSNSVPRNVK